MAARISILGSIAAVVLLACGDGAVTTTTDVTVAPQTSTVAPTNTAGPITDPPRSTTTTPDAELELWGGNVTVIDSGRPVVCRGAVLTSLPPQCSGPDLAGLVWNDVPWAESAGDTRWASMYVEVAIDGEGLALVSSPEESRETDPPSIDRFLPPCPEPPGGWVFEPGPLATEDALEQAFTYINDQPDVSGTWVHNLFEPSAQTEGRFELVLVATFAGATAQHEAAIREVWGGPLCVIERPWEERALRRIQRELSDLFFDDPPAGLHWPSSFSVDVIRGVVQVGALIVEAPAQAWADDRYGSGVVELESQLVRVP